MSYKNPADSGTLSSFAKPILCLMLQAHGLLAVSLLRSLSRSSAFLTSTLSYLYWSLLLRLPISSTLQAYPVLHVHSKHAFSLGPLHLLFSLPGTLSLQISACSLTSLGTWHTLLIIKQCPPTVTFVSLFMFIFLHSTCHYVTLLLLFTYSH